ncbi:phage tail tape measure protein [Serratia rhizosphaerae]|uniref:phage tail tape measure protein n=1 Tax=Serratia rhizosphaerae TaxID=2597702 RepID=UPI002DB5E183|nr:phage tail tape measure protein [Serratia rhizosphaerae]MEB6334291.1 phage tail tape measure protein [Serratia rhizosphaerae]
MSNSLKLQVLLQAVDKATRPLKSIQTASKTLAGDIKTTQQTLKTLDAQAAKIEGFRKANGQLAVTKQSLAAAKREAAELAAKFKATEKPTAQQARLLAAAKSQAASLQTKYNGLRQTVQRQRNALHADGIATRNLATEQRRLKQSAGEATATLNRQRSELERLSKKQASLGRIQRYAQAGKGAAASVRNQSAVGLGVATAAGYAESRFIAPGIQFDRQMSDTQATLGLAKDAKQLAAIRQQARDIGATTAFSPTDVARTQSVLAKSGFNGDAILKSTESTVNLALASDLDIADAADIITNMQSSFNLPIGEIQRVADVMTKGFTSSNSNLMDFGEAMKYVAPIAEAAGASIEDTTAMLGVLADNGIKGSMAGTAASAMFTRLQAPVGQAQDALNELGVKTKDRKGNMLPIADILKSIDKSFRKNRLGTAQQAEYLKTIFGEEAMKGAIKLIDAAGNGKLADKHGTVSNAKGATEAIAKTKTDNLDGDLKNLSSAYEDIQIEVFDKQNSGLRQLTQSATDWLGVAGAWAKKNPELAATLFKVAMGVTAAIGGMALLGFLAAPVIAGFSLLLLPVRKLGGGLWWLTKVSSKLSFKGITQGARGLGRLMAAVGRISLGGLVKGIRLVGSALLWMGRALMANPILAVIGLIAMAGITIWQNWDTLAPKFQAAWETIKDATLGAWDTITTATAQAWESVKTSTKNAWDNLKSWLGGKWGELVSDVKALPGKFKEAGLNMINGIIDGISERWQALKDKFSSLTDMLPDWMKPGADKAEINATVTKSDVPAGSRVAPAAVSAAVLSLSSPVMAVQPVAAQPAANPAPVYFTIHAAPGQDEKGIAREVARQLASEQRKQAAARRSRMSDGE